jgi:hypothetical protein
MKLGSTWTVTQIASLAGYGVNKIFMFFIKYLYIMKKWGYGEQFQVDEWLNRSSSTRHLTEKYNGI